MGKNSTVHSQSFSPSHPANMLRSHLSEPFSRLTDPLLLRIVGAKLAVQGRYKLSLFLCVLSRSLQGITERPLPCNYNVIQFVCARSRR
jgi:hypothetical protein